jgi:hypothetical protein
MIKEIAEEVHESWRVVKLSESDYVSISEDRAFEEINQRRSNNPCVSCPSSDTRLSNSELGCWRMFEVPLDIQLEHHSESNAEGGV